MVDAERLARVLTRIRQDLATLRRYADADRGELLADEVRPGTSSTCSSPCWRAASTPPSTSGASEGYGPPDSNADAMHVLARNGILPDRLADTWPRGSLRNVLVHLYADVDDARVVAHLDRLDDVERYVAALAALLESDAPEDRVGQGQGSPERYGNVSGTGGRSGTVP